MKSIIIILCCLLAACVGPKGDPGTIGKTGNEGPTGQQGISGIDGTNATPITIVNLCPGTPNYPNVFIEIALCINNQLYGVYSLNNGFMTLLPPGNYTSNALGSACNLTISENCVVSY